ncbi:tyrosine--tRNA ligase [Candidatus Berkelbacteria bacterium]|nr:tyrosine--tRNA ligase [Candidatus Berkelbacteria bacterium]
MGYNKNRMSIEEVLSRGVAEVIVADFLRRKLKSGKKLRVKFGIDPTAPDLHFGHAVVLRKLRQFQDLGHLAVLIIGDFTAQIGDPSDKQKTRLPLTAAEVKQNAKTYLEQAYHILDPEKTEVHRQSEWFSNFDLKKVFKLLSKATVKQHLEHETFSLRLKKDLPLSLHELIYPLLQGYDSLMLRADLELGGTDQKFNLLMGREIQKAFGQKPQDILTLQYLIGLDGKEKMGKSLKNYIALNDSPSEMYGKVMSIPDDLILQYFELLTDVKEKALKIIQKELKTKSRNPREIKSKLAKLLVETFYDALSAEQTEAEFNRVFRQKEIPTKLTTVALAKKTWFLADLLVKLKLAASKSAARRLLQQGGVRINSQVVGQEGKITVSNGWVIQAGKRRFVKIKV